MYLFCIPAGGTNPFPGWKRKLEGSKKLAILDIPGRGSRRREAPEEDFSRLVDSMTAELERINEAHEPYMIFGYCFGAAVGYEMCRRLKEAGKELPSQFVIFGGAAPGCEPAVNEKGRTDTPEFRKMISQFLSPIAVGSAEAAEAAQKAYIKAHSLKGTGNVLLSDVFREVDEDSEYAFQMLINLINDSMKQIETDDRMLLEYSRNYQASDKLDIPATVIYGDSDSFVPKEKVDGWRNCFSETEYVCMNGDHYVIASQPQPFIDLVNKL